MLKYENSIIIFGSETMVYQNPLLINMKNKTFRIPMLNNSRSLNLSNAVAIVAYEVWRQLKFSRPIYG